MKISEIISQSEKPELYEKGTSFMWTDEHISKQLLNIHINPDVNLASRKKSTIEKTAYWILNTQKEKGKLNILDLGCGLGLSQLWNIDLRNMKKFWKDLSRNEVPGKKLHHHN